MIASKASREWQLCSNLAGRRKMNRWYDARTGTWISHDPIGFEAGDANLYRYVGNGPTNGVDPNGLWKVTRSGGAKATAISEHGDTIEELAKLIGLNPSEFDEWLTFDSAAGYGSGQIGPNLFFPGSIQVDTELCKGQQFKIPNTVLAVWMGELGSVGQFLVAWELNLMYARHLGFKVVDISPASQPYTSASQILLDAKTKTANKELHGWLSYSHGASNGLTNDGWTPNSNKVAFTYADLSKNLEYRLGLIMVNACHALDCPLEGAHLLASSFALTGYKKGWVIPIVWDFSLRRIIREGQQETNATRFETPFDNMFEP